MTKPQAITWRFRHLQEIQGGKHMKHIEERMEDKILKLSPEEVAKMHKEYGRVIRIPKLIDPKDVKMKQKTVEQ